MADTARLPLIVYLFAVACFHSIPLSEGFEKNLGISRAAASIYRLKTHDYKL